MALVHASVGFIIGVVRREFWRRKDSESKGSCSITCLLDVYTLHYKYICNRISDNVRNMMI